METTATIEGKGGDKGRGEGNRSGCACGSDYDAVPGWSQWWGELKMLAATYDWPVEDGDEEFWVDYFQDDYTPLAALNDDMSYE